MIILIVIHIVGMLIVVMVWISLIIYWDDLFVIYSLSVWDSWVMMLVDIVGWVFSVSFICKGTVVYFTLIKRPDYLGVAIVVVGIIVMAIIVGSMLWHAVVLVIHVWVVFNWMVVVRIVSFVV